MRISKTWLRPILTALMFPVVLLGAMWILDATSGDEWLPWTHPRYSRIETIRLAETSCFRQFPDYGAFRPWHAKLVDGRWRIMGTRSGLPWFISQKFEPLMFAAIDDRDGVILSCTRLSDGW